MAGEAILPKGTRGIAAAFLGVSNFTVVLDMTVANVSIPHIAGSLGVGVLGGVYRMKWLLFWMYATRALAVAIYLAAPKTSATFYAFAFVLGGRCAVIRLCQEHIRDKGHAPFRLVKVIFDHAQEADATDP